METQEIKTITEEFAERRMESYIRVFTDLLQDNNEKMLVSVNKEIKTTVNGKIDAIKAHLERQDKMLLEMKPILTTKIWLYNFFKGLMWVAGVVITVGGAIVVINKLIK